ncbi:uncharacterized protein MELLADRAFT_89926 [Melampsora larici-populina 98AG31]|uniref:Orotidine 5'-phosphate decarboxylase n=1 Tax=Melampsora larici-populina (strain 98AG31 / pathotype 3-4-7) TaxID=747676 RepID=F4RV49_MELLP|nr:uncharacterized protein MELLADRAFT_89926 [Melampsora larici-populina 98AG31]EGG03811.1 hypothetical protein MELLADRAFT_89926 [Melampsora larici-populina 98AG31]
MERIKITQQYTEFGIGSISQRRFESNEEEDQLVLCPGVRLNVMGDTLGQHYNPHHQVVLECGSDMIIMGCGMYINVVEYNKVLKQTSR